MDNIKAWPDSIYSQIVQFCNINSLKEIHSGWKRYLEVTLEQLQLLHQESMAKKERWTGGHGEVSMSFIRAAGSASTTTLQDADKFSDRRWRDNAVASKSQLNPLFFATSNARDILHPGTKPTLGFPLATAYVPLKQSAQASIEAGELSSVNNIISTAFSHFEEWPRAFQRQMKKGIMIRLYVSGALAFAITLRNGTKSAGQGFTANIAYKSPSCQPLVLEDFEKSARYKPMPRQFNTIDTSNLADFVGQVNLLVSCGTLLKDNGSSMLYTESLRHGGMTDQELITGLFVGDVKLLSLLLGLVQPEV